MASVPKAVEVSEGDSSKKRMRSPAYPYINLEGALRRAKEFYDKETRGAAYLRVAAKHWGYEEKSSAALQTAAALISFGLMRDEGTGEKRKLQLTQNALRILLDQRPESKERDEAIKQAALAPKIHSELWRRFGASTSNEQLRHTLILDWTPPFNENSVDGFIREYRDTISFGKLCESDKVTPEDDGSEANSGIGGAYVPKVGDYVQWESQDILQFVEPKRIRAISTDGTHAFVDGSSTGLPVEQLSPAKAPLVAVKTESRTTLPPTNNMQEDVFSLAEGRVVIQWPSPLSTESIKDLQDWLKLVERKISRAIVVSTADAMETKD